MLILNAQDVRRTLPMKEAIEAMKAAYAALSDGTAVVPLRTRLPIPASQALSLFMPAYVGSESVKALAIKAVSLFPTNPARGLAYIQAAVLVFDPETGRALALIEGSSLTAIRTGAGGGAAVDLLSRKDSRVAAIFGAGPQARTQLEGTATVRDLETIYIYARTRVNADALARELRSGGIKYNVWVASTPKQAVQNADIICTATTSNTPVFEDSDLKPGTHISAVGSYTSEMQEVPAATVRRAKVVVDSRAACMEEAGDILQPIRAGLIDASHIHAELGEIVLGRRPGRQSDEEITYFKSVGVAVQDAVAADLALRNAHKMNLGTEVDF